MTIKINVGVNKKIGLPDYGSAGGHCNIEIEADNSILDNADQFLQRVQDAYELARQSVLTGADHGLIPGGINANDVTSELQRILQKQAVHRNAGALAGEGRA